MTVTGLHGEATTMHAQSAHALPPPHTPSPADPEAHARVFFNKTKISTLREYDFDTPSGLACGSNLPTAAVTFTLAAAASCLLESQQDKMDKLYCSQPATYHKSTRAPSPNLVSPFQFHFLFKKKDKDTP
jgi:hypothetical protein